MWSASHSAATSASHKALGITATFLQNIAGEEPASTVRSPIAAENGEAAAARRITSREQRDSTHAYGSRSLPWTSGWYGERGTRRTLWPRRINCRISSTRKASVVPYGKYAVT